ncbi:MAG: hypothetical protein LBV04_08710 [Deferribacteraceae bacterium]|jgi:hypothetical protein|nr:hypothetical protein [Deferribacteraceae bacterium]
MGNSENYQKEHIERPGQLNSSSDSVKARIAKLESDVGYIKDYILDIRSDARTSRSEFKVELAELRSDLKDMRKEATENFHKMIGVMLGVTGIIIAVIVAFLSK